MTVLTIFLHTLLVLTLGPLIAGLGRHAASGGGWRTIVAPYLELNAGLRAPGEPHRGHVATLAAASVAGLLIPLFSPDAVLGFVGDGFTAFLLLAGLTLRYFPLPLTSLLSVAASLWALGTLTNTTDLAQALTGWQAGLGSGLIFLGLVLGVAPVLAPPTDCQPATEGDLSAGLSLWARSTLQLGWLGLGSMAFPWTAPLTTWASFAGSLGLFAAKLVALSWGLAAVRRRWPGFPLSGLGLACALLGLGLVKVGV